MEYVNNEMEFIMFKSKNEVEKGLSIIIVGCGKVGSTLVEQLMKENHDITIIDKDSEKVQSLAGLYDIMGVIGNGASFSVQKEAGVDNADLLIAVTGSDELNLLCCTIAKQVAGCAAIARVRTPDYSTDEIIYLRNKLDLALIINPEQETAREACSILALPTALEVNAFAHGQAEMIKFKVPEDNMLAGMEIFKLGKTLKTSVLICAIERNGEVMIPSGNTVIEKGDIISFVSTRKYAKRFFNEIGFKTHQVKDTLIIGGGKAAYYLAARLLKSGIDVKIIEKDKKRCEELSVLLPQAIIINGDGTDEELLKEEGIQYVESFVPLTGIDEENVMLTLYAKQVSNAKVITKINRNSFKNVFNQLDLGSVIYPRYITAEAIIAYVRAKKDSLGSNIETLYHLFDSKVEAIEFQVREGSKVTDVSLAELSLKKDLLVTFINRDGKIIFPSGSDCIKVGDTVMIVTTQTGLGDICDILQ